MKLNLVFGLFLLSLLISHDASAFLPLTPGTIIIQQTTTTSSSKQGTYNQTLANNVVVNSGGLKLNFINGSGNPVNVKNSTNGMVNITIASGSMGVTSLNALTGALTISCVSGNTTCTSSGGNTITINTAYNIVTTGSSAQIITKPLTINNLVLGGDETVDSNALVNLGHKSTLPTTTGILCQTNMTGTCGSGTGTIIGSQNVGKATGSVGPLSTASSTNIKGRNFTGTSPITVTKTNDTDIALGCSTCVTSVSGTTGNITSSGGTTPIINTGGNVVVIGGNAQNFTSGKKVGFIPTSVTAGILIGTTSSNPTSLRQGDVFISGAFMGYNDNTNTTRQLVNLNSAQSLSSKTLADTSTFVASVGDSSKKIGFLNSGASTSTTLLLQDNQTSSQHLNWPAIRETETLAVIPQTAQHTNTTVQSTSSASFVMTGNTVSITPQVTGKIRVYFTGYASSGTLLDGCIIEVQEGTGTAPKGGAAVTGTTVGVSITATSATAAANVPFAIIYPITGLTLGTAVWFQPAFSNAIGGTCSLRNNMMSLTEY